MEHRPELHEWELILASDLSDNKKSNEIHDEEIEDGSIKADYFALEYVGRRHAPSEEEGDEVGNDSDNPSWADPDSDSRFLGTSRGKLGFVGMKPTTRNSEGFWSDESSDKQISPLDSENGEIGNLGNSFMETPSEENDVRCDTLGGESEEIENPGMQQTSSVDGDIVPVREDEKKKRIWWKIPLELVKLCIFRARPVWSITVAAAMLGIVMLGRKLYRMKRKSKSISLNIAMDEKASQLVARSTHLNAISLVRHMPLIRPSLPSTGTSQWSALPLR